MDGGDRKLAQLHSRGGQNPATRAALFQDSGASFSLPDQPRELELKGRWGTGARLAGAARIIASDPIDFRRTTARKLGATDLLDPTCDDVVTAAKDLTGGIGVDYAFEAVGSGRVIETGIAATRSGGTTVCVGAAPITEAIQIAPAALFTASEKKLFGCLLGSSNSLREIPRLIALWQSGRLDLEALITQRRPLEEINEAMDDLSAGRGIRTVLSL